MTTTDRKAWEQEQRRTRIIDKAETVFFRSGYDKATLPAIAEAAGYNKRTLYLYFKDREEIFLAVVLRSLSRLQAALETAGESCDRGSSRLAGLAEAFFDFSTNHPDDLDLIMIYETRYFAYHDPTASTIPDSYFERCQQRSEAIARLVTSAIESGMALGSIKTDLTPRQLMLILWGQILGVMKILRIREKNFTVAFGIGRRTLFECFVGMVERSLAE